MASSSSGSGSETPDFLTELAHGGAGVRIFPMVMSIGYNPFYKNTVRSAEVHILHGFGADFYGAPLRLEILGYVRPELDYVDRESLVRDIRTDIEVAARSLERATWRWQALQDGGRWLWSVSAEEIDAGHDKA